MVMDVATLVLSTGISSSVLQPVAERIIALILLKYGKVCDYEDKLLKLEAKMLKLQCMVDDLENKPVSRCCGILVEKMRHTLLNVDDLFTYIEARVGASDYIEAKLKEQVTDMLDTLNYWCQEIEPLFVSERAKLSSSQTLRITGSCSFIDESKVIGREDEKEKVITWLFESQKEDDVDVISLVGMPGIGKTTVAQFVYNDPLVVSKFVLRMWVHVSKDYDVVKIMKLMLECATNKVCKLSHQDAIRNQVKLVLNKKFLLVLDDVCNEALYDWDGFKLLFRFAHPGSRVIITTRSKTVSSIVTSNDHESCLDILSDDHCWGIIKHSLRINVEQRQDLKEIGVKLAENCKGVPLVAKVIGDYLCTKSDKREWDNLLNCDILNLDNNLYDVLKLSYDHLPADLKPCFTYCSVIPQCHRVKEEDLIQMWAAQGFIRAQGARRIEDIGKEYFNELRSRYLLQKSSTGEVELHDFIHDLARLVSTGFCFCLDDMSRFLNVSSNVRHLCLLYQLDKPEVLVDLLKKCCTLTKLRTLKLVFHSVRPLSDLLESEHFGKLFRSFQLLRVLDLSGSGISKLSNLVGNNTNLHYLNLSGTLIKHLPDSICNLIGLETLKLLDGPSIRQWPSNFEKLIKLRHLDYPRQGNLNMPRALGKLTRLETLHTFVVKSEEGYEIGELEDMNCLCGSILIRGLENVTDLKKAEAAMLENKKFLDKLELQWDQQRVPTDQTMHDDQEVLRGLKPHSRLTELEIKGYHGVSLPDWLGNASCKLEKLVVNSCEKLDSLPSLHYLTSLKKLEIQGCPNLKSLPRSGLSSSLENLSISESGIEKQWCEQGGSEWEKIKSISTVEIDGQRIPTPASAIP
ncbi:hypothetical protein ABKV19_000148 [Rosa sericea]